MMSGMIRKIGEYGRFVIPKEIRSILKLKEGDAIEISVDKNAIKLEKCIILNHLEGFCELYLNAFYSEQCGCSAVICNTDFILAAKGISISNKAPISDRIKKQIRDFESYLYEKEDEIAVFDSGKFKVNALYPIGTKEKPAGAFVLIRNMKDATIEQCSNARLLSVLLSIIIKNRKS